jgi:hypothetical protein
MLSVKEYDEAEQEARIGLSFAEIMAFAPRTFQALGFPDRVRDERELVRYADWNRDTGNQEYFWPDHFFAGPAVRTVYTHDEAEAMNRVRDQAVEVTRKLGRTVRPLCGPFAQLGLFRILMTIGKACGGPLRVFEVGPGTGYLGAMLWNEEWTYGFTDNAQALFLWQSLFLRNAGLPRLKGVPWWQFVRGEHLPAADVVVSNTNLAEMTGDAMRITLLNARRMLQGSSLGFFLFTNIGAPMHGIHDNIHNELLRQGFRLIFNRLFHGYALGQLPEGAEVLDSEIPLFNPSGRGGTLSGAEAVQIPEGQEPLDLPVTKLLEGWEPPKGV